MEQEIYKVGKVKSKSVFSHQSDEGKKNKEIGRKGTQLYNCVPVFLCQAPVWS